MTSRQQASAFGFNKVLLGAAVAGVGFFGGVSARGWDPPKAMAQSPAAVDKVVQLNKKAMEDLDLADFESAKKELLEAVTFGKKNGLETHPVMARTYVHVGALYVLGLKDKAKGQEYFTKAIEVQSDIKLDKNLKDNKDLQKLFAAALASVQSASTADASGHKNAAPEAHKAEPAPSGAAEADEDDEDPELPANVAALDCPAKDETQEGQPVTLRCAAAPSLGVHKVVVFFKGAGMDAYEEADMEKNAKGWWVSQIPKKRVEGKSIQFYFEGRDASDKPLVSNGRAESPLVMLVTSADQASRSRTSNDDDDPLNFGKEDSGWGIGVFDPDHANRRAWISVAVGTGFGIADDRLEARRDLRQPIQGFAWAGVGHFAPELGIMITPRVSFAVQGRLQYIAQNDISSKVAGRGALSALGKLSFYTAQSRNRFFFTLEGGGGEGFRFAYIKSDPKRPDLNDTVLAGPWIGGAGAGFLHEFGSAVSWVFEANLLVGAPHIGVVVDFSTGFQFQFGSTKKRVTKDKDAASSSVDDEPDDK